MATEQREMVVLMNGLEQTDYWRQLFEKYDVNEDGRISYEELKNIIHSKEYAHDLPDNLVDDIMKKADHDKSGYLEYNEFVDMMQNPDLKSVFGHYFENYIRIVIPPRRHVQITGRTYEEQYRSCWPPAVVMILISIVEVVLFCSDAAFGHIYGDGKIAQWFIYDPDKREEAWRFLTYMLVHYGVLHLISNLLIQLFVGFPLEVVHRWWRVMLIYLAGVLAGSLATSITDPSAILAGASGGVYALSSAHVATIIMNWKEMNTYSVVIQLLIFIVLFGLNFLQSISFITFVPHLAGVAAGLLVGIVVLRNLTQRKWEKYLCLSMVVLYFCLTITGILIHIFWNTRFQEYTN
ncbi:unnamed protein product [Arctia plantaginis]|uniref:EF-hand domain-containing protein n=1 Tax=Arctia plantaginis TaxID=874455 RepID=A0A8S0YLM6_ARCPL|nr:unnamed protein product [Arctia plantaginis]